jgi:hypothetical protein
MWDLVQQERRGAMEIAFTNNMRKHLPWMALLVGGISVVMFIRTFGELDSALRFLDSLPGVCPLKRATGLECAFCGMTHAVFKMVYGDFSGAMQSNALSLPMISIAGTLSVFKIFGYRPRIAALTNQVLIAGMLFIFLAYAILRNL